MTFISLKTKSTNILPPLNLFAAKKKQKVIRNLYIWSRYPGPYNELNRSETELIIKFQIRILQLHHLTVHSECVSDQVPPVGVEGGAGEVATVDLQRILDTKVSAGKDVVGEGYLGVTEGQYC